ncbi:hypothetical protein HPP92_001978 [Vanilla planifolia]|uniref:Uncharacterized protein n=1 Tax=Vanilla planifolia TaxID=51239 RepID=A0A835VFV2_VANPL|nr:hypothetical protein HPP92_001978 [Vanilla planifolia]
MGAEAKRSTLPTSRSGAGNRRRQIHKTFNNVKITILCGFVTILVLRGTIGVGNLGGALDADSDKKVVEDIERILREIRTEADPEDDGAAQFSPLPRELNHSGQRHALWCRSRRLHRW